MQFKTPLQELLIDTMLFLLIHTFGYDIVYKVFKNNVPK